MAEAELWIVGNPRMSLAPLHHAAARAPGTVRFVPRFVGEDEIPALFRRADLIALPYRDSEHSGVVYTALAFGKPMVLSSVGGFPELAAEHGAARIVAPGDPVGLAAALEELISDQGARGELADAAPEGGRGPLLLGRRRGPDDAALPGAGSGAAMIWTLLEAVFWGSVALIVYTHLGYPLALWLINRLRPAPPPAGAARRVPPFRASR